ncbi:hypothetical protein P7C71_g4662, partial [Lecanoromycetidae sp. Uapishka_2]
MNRRQELNRQAQRTHRERKELYAKSLETQNLQLKEQLASTVKQRDAYANENRILKDLLRVNGIAYHASPFAIDTLPQDNTHEQGNAYTNSQASFATAPQSNGMATHHTNGYSVPPSNYESSSNTASPNDIMPDLITPDMPPMSLSTVPSTNSIGSSSEGQNSQLTQHADYSTSTFATAPSNGDVFSNGYYPDNASSYTTTSADTGYAQTMAPANSNLMVTNGNGFDLDRHIGQLELQVGNGRQQMYGIQTNGSMGYQNNTGLYVPPAFDFYQWMREFVFALESSCGDHAELMIKRGAVRDSAELSGHAMMLSCPPHSVIVDSLSNPNAYPRDAPATVAPQDFEIQLATATSVDMNGEVNPFGAINMIRRDERFPAFTENEFNMIKMDLQLKSRCYGFGAMLEEFEVNDAMDYAEASRYGPEAVETLRRQKLLQSKYTSQLKPHYSNGHTAIANPQQHATHQQQHYTNGQMYTPAFN